MSENLYIEYGELPTYDNINKDTYEKINTLSLLFYLSIPFILFTFGFLLYVFFKYDYHKNYPDMNSSINGSLISYDSTLNISQIITPSITINEIYNSNGNTTIHGNLILEDKGSLIFPDPYIIRINDTKFMISPYSFGSNNEMIFQNGGFTMLENGYSGFNILNPTCHLDVNGTVKSTYLNSNIINSDTLNTNTGNFENIEVFDIRSINITTDTLNATSGIIGGVTLTNNTISFNGQLELLGNSTIVTTRNGVRTTVFDHVATLVRILTQNITEPIVRGNLTIVAGQISFSNAIYLVPSEEGLYLYTTPEIFGIFQGIDGRVGIGTNMPNTIFDVNGVTTSKGIANSNGILNTGGITTSGTITSTGDFINNGNININGNSNLNGDLNVININTSSITAYTAIIYNSTTEIGIYNTLNVTRFYFESGIINELSVIRGSFDTGSINLLTSEIHNNTGELITNSLLCTNATMSKLTTTGNITITTGSTLLLNSGTQTLDERIDARTTQRTKLFHLAQTTTTSSGSFIDLSTFIYLGSIEQTLTNVTWMVSTQNTAVSFEVQIIDITNTQTIFTTPFTSNIADHPHIFSYSTFSNIPTYAAGFKLQFKKTAGTGTITFYDAIIHYI